MEEPFHLQEDKTLLLLKGLEEANIVAGMTTRIGGMSETPYNTLNMGYHVSDNKEHVTRNYELVESNLSIPKSRWVSAKQVHKSDVLIVDKPFLENIHQSPPNFDIQYDGFITNEKNILLTAVYADCVPLFFYDTYGNWVGLAHAGWRGTVKGIGRKIITSLMEQGIPMEAIHAVIGPSISQACYEVDRNVIDQIPLTYHTNAIMKQRDENHFLLDLKQLNKNVLLETGLEEKQIKISKYCTYRSQDLFYSHRRDNGKTGRMMAFIGRKDKEE